MDQQGKSENEKNVKRLVRDSYAMVAKSSGSCCGPANACCGDKGAKAMAESVGYTKEELAALPEEAVLGLGCGNPTAFASLSEGEVVLDLGSGAGIDCFLASSRVGSSGRVIGVDMTPEMIEKAERGAKEGGYANVEFRLGEIEDLPVDDDSIDIAISNCVINLSPNKAKVFGDVFRVLRPGGRIMVSDIVLLKELPEFIRDSASAYVGCVGGALLKSEYLRLIEEAGFSNITIHKEASYPIDCVETDPFVKAEMKRLNMSKEGLEQIIGSVVSISVEAKKPT